MKKIILGVFIACVTFLSANAQDKNGPQIEFDKVVHDYGTIENGADGTCEFKFKNTGKEDLLISNCRASCGCTIPSWPREAIKPGKSEVITVKYDTKRTGHISKTITITSNATNEPNKVLSIKGQINAPKTQAAVATPTPPVPAPAAKTETMVVTKAPKKETEKTTEVKKRRWFQFWKKK